YSIEATFEPVATNEDVRAMIQSLLAERFKMRFHRTSVTTEGYALSPGRGKSKLEPAKPDAPESYVSATTAEAGVVQLTGRNSSMTELAVTLQRVQKTPIWDRSGVAGSYDFAFRYALDSSADVRTEAPSLVAALQESLGLTLKKEKGALETLVIDSIEQ